MLNAFRVSWREKNVLRWTRKVSLSRGKKLRKQKSKNERGNWESSSWVCCIRQTLKQKLFFLIREIWFFLVGKSFLDWTVNICQRLMLCRMLIIMLIRAIWVFICCFRLLIDWYIMRLSWLKRKCFWHFDWHLKGSFDFKRINIWSNNNLPESTPDRNVLKRENVSRFMFYVVTFAKTSHC